MISERKRRPLPLNPTLDPSRPRPIKPIPPQNGGPIGGERVPTPRPVRGERGIGGGPVKVDPQELVTAARERIKSRKSRVGGSTALRSALSSAEGRVTR